MMAAMERILVIDDDVELCHLVGEYLRAEGFTVECVHDGESGLKKATAGEYLLAVLCRSRCRGTSYRVNRTLPACGARNLPPVGRGFRQEGTGSAANFPRRRSAHERRSLPAR